jgi:predicted flap endonuclease-1-like 5' DNA nuclease
VIELASKIIGCLIAAALIGFFIGYIVGKYTSKKKKHIPTQCNDDFKVHGNIYNRPIILSKPRPTGADDLKEIEGIDEKIESELNELGIFHYDQISKWSRKNCDWVDKYLNLEDKIKEDNWIEQAKVLIKKR